MSSCLSSHLSSRHCARDTRASARRGVNMNEARTSSRLAARLGKQPMNETGTNERAQLEDRQARVAARDQRPTTSQSCTVTFETNAAPGPRKPSSRAINDDVARTADAHRKRMRRFYTRRNRLVQHFHKLTNKYQMSDAVLCTLGAPIILLAPRTRSPIVSRRNDYLD